MVSKSNRYHICSHGHLCTGLCLGYSTYETDYREPGMNPVSGRKLDWIMVPYTGDLVDDI